MADRPPLLVNVTDTWSKVPSRNDTLWISRRVMLPWYEVMWLSYLTIVRDLLRAGF